MLVISEKDKTKVASMWGQKPSDSVSFYTFPPVRDYLNECVTGERADGEQKPVGADEWVFMTFLGGRLPVAECLSLCCGFGARDRDLARRGVFVHCTGLDISENVIREATASARSENANIDYYVADLDRAELGVEKYDLVYAGGALHHIASLEHVIDQVHRCLKPKGILMSDEYVGPAYNNLSERHREIVNAVIHLLPAHLRWVNEDRFVPRFWRSPGWRRGLFEIVRLTTLRQSTIDFEEFQIPSIWRPSTRAAFYVVRRMSEILGRRQRSRKRRFRFGQVWDVCPEAIRRGDPSEGVRADEIIPIVKSRFPDTTVRYFNGSILHYALDRAFFTNYEDARDRRMLEGLMELERIMIAREEIPPILAVIVARK